MDTSPGTPQPRRGRGRPREVVRRAPGEGTPLDRRPADSPRTTAAILDAAHRVLLRAGTAGLTLVAVAREAHVDVTTVSYHFGTRHGLIEALMDRLYQEQVADFAAEARELRPGRERRQAYLDGVGRMCQDGDATRAYFAIAVLGLHDDALRARLAKLNAWTVRAFADTIHGDAATPERPMPDPERLRVIGEFVYAAVDGIELHHALGDHTYPLHDLLAILDDVVAWLLARDSP
ncbi:TetR/AcrR family transcriptional regulator [Embleya hyalina]|uniref:TetR family transcriptional regulator n=1 Tax=Embleya hyalina TaxID=516124 RepID=A0A401YEZ9_9ACTN|nr:TetR/AcrR family transcriptional regulator [Embleya hyalina]GCD93138.1 TetR family transcriptional regulator [Embleya hyalina]